MILKVENTLHCRQTYGGSKDEAEWNEGPSKTSSSLDNVAGADNSQEQPVTRVTSKGRINASSPSGERKSLVEVLVGKRSLDKDADVEEIPQTPRPVEDSICTEDKQLDCQPPKPPKPVKPPRQRY